MSKPRGQCAQYIREHAELVWYETELAIENQGHKVIQITSSQLMASFHAGAFRDGPYVDSFGDGYGEPYTGKRQIFGLLKSGEVVYCEQGVSDE